MLVDLGTNSYEITIADDFSQLGIQLKSNLCGKKICIVSEKRIAELYLDDFQRQVHQAGFETIVCLIEGGEHNKNLQTVQNIYTTLMTNQFDRKSTIIALGGGIVGDIAGFAAATYMRGIDFIQIPTTLLAQVDSSVGGKVGVNFKDTKNSIGNFYQPKLVYINTNTLHTLTENDYISGLGEVVKYAVMYDLELFSFLENEFEKINCRNKETVQQIIRRCCEIKSQIVSQDEKENGIRAILNLGHTFAHGFESITNFNLSHGQCVGIGIICAGYLSELLGYMKREEIDRVKSLCEDLHFPLSVEYDNFGKLYEYIKSDKKSENGKLKFIVPIKIGEVKIMDNISEDQIKACCEKVHK